MPTLTPAEISYVQQVEATREKRMKWWREARFGMFVHWGLYAQIGRNEWAMNLERIPVAEYEKLAATWEPRPGAMRNWARLARDAGMKYMVLTTKHHEGFLLWDSKLSDYNATRHGPGRDLVVEFVEACREFGLKVGFYYSLMDWHHPDGHRCANDEAARLRFTQYTYGLVRELMSNYGKIDILWYDVSWPLTSAQAWDSFTLNAMARTLQPHIIINDRSQIPEDFGTPEEHITAADPGRAWEACMTFNGSWGWQQTPPEDWHSARKVIDMLRTCVANDGNLLLNVGPLPDGKLPSEAIDRLTKVGKWLKTYGGAVYGPVERVSALTSAVGNWTRKNAMQYLWVSRWPGRELALGAVVGKAKAATLYPSGKKLKIEQTPGRLVLKGLPENCPDKVAGVGMIAIEFAGSPRQFFSAGCEMPKMPPIDLMSKWLSAGLKSAQVSKTLPLKGDIGSARLQSLSDALGWRTIGASSTDGFLSVHALTQGADGMVYFAARFEVARAGVWNLHLGHDGGAKVFMDGKETLVATALVNPSLPGRSKTEVTLSEGIHEVVVAFDLAGGSGWGIFLHWELAAVSRKGVKKPWFPVPVLV